MKGPGVTGRRPDLPDVEPLSDHGRVRSKPWLLRFFDQIRFFPVSEIELLAFREDFPRGKIKLAIEPTTFRLGEYPAFLSDNRDSIQAFKQKQQAAFEAERERWSRLPPPPEISELDPIAQSDGKLLADDGSVIRAHLTGSVW